MCDSRIFAPIGPTPLTTERADFGPRGYVVYGYPSAGEVPIKEDTGLFDMFLFSAPRTHNLQRSPSDEEKDRFFHLMRRVVVLKFW